MIEDFGESRYMMHRSKLNYINENILVKFILENKILDTLILGENPHPELIKRSTEIVTFLCR